MTDEDRKKYIDAVFARFKEMAGRDLIGAAIEFITWLRSPDGALAWPYLWKPEYVEQIRDITYYGMGFVNKMLIRRMIETGKM